MKFLLIIALLTAEAISARLTPHQDTKDHIPLPRNHFFISSRQGLTNDPCDNNADCVPPRTCVVTHISVPFVTQLPCANDDVRISVRQAEGLIGCWCQPPRRQACSFTSECPQGEVCSEGGVCISAVSVSGTQAPTVSAGPSSGSPTASVAPTSQPQQSGFASPSPITTTEGVPICIAAHLLRHLPRSALVFDKDEMAHVLCDKANSCATEGHMVVYHGRTMMMASYCRQVGCERRRMAVNSVRYQRGLRVPSSSEGLVFTAFAARYATRVEERMLAVAVRIGL